MDHRQSRIQVIAAYDQWILDRVTRGWQPHFVNFMFREITGSRAKKIRIMEDEVGRVYETLVTNVVRHPNRQSWKEYKPLLIGSPDLPVIKMEKKSAWHLIVNNGWHFNACLLLPPFEKCRLRTSLGDHFRQSKSWYIWPKRHLIRIDVTELSFPAIADYVFKHFKRGNVGSNEILILPRTITELSDTKTLQVP